MGRRGFPPKNKASRVLTGQLPITKANLKPVLVVSGPYSAPPGFDEAQRKAWDEIVETLRYSGTLANADRRIIEGFSRSFVTWQKVEAEYDDMLAKAGGFTKAFIIQGVKSSYILHPIWKALREARQEILNYMIQLGLTPSARQRMESGAADVAEKKVNVFRKLRDAENEL